MNKQELLSKLKKNRDIVAGANSQSPAALTLLRDKLYIYEKIIDYVEQLDEPQKPKVPEYVAEWLQWCKYKELSLGYALYSTDAMSRPGIDEWFSIEGNQDRFAEAWLNNNYEIEGPKYRVKLGNGYFIDYQGRGCLISPYEKDGIMIFKAKKEAERTATIIGGTVEPVEVAE